MEIKMTVNEISEKYGLNELERTSFLSYLENKFTAASPCASSDTPPFDKWKVICCFAASNGASEALNRYITPKMPVVFSDPDGVRLEMYDSFAGSIPIVYIKDSGDFEHFITNAVYKGTAPMYLSTTGASFIYGKTMRFIVLSSKPYSGIEASKVGLSDKEWKEKSMLIRREHECTHYFTKQKYGISRNNLHDELIADFFGICAAFGEYRAELFLKFMGIGIPYKGRLKYYTNDLPDKVCKAVAETAIHASAYLERYSKTSQFLEKNREERIVALCETGLADMLL